MQNSAEALSYAPFLLEQSRPINDLSIGRLSSPLKVLESLLLVLLSSQSQNIHLTRQPAAEWLWIKDTIR